MGEPTTPAYSYRSQLRQPVTRRRIARDRMYAKLVYRVHKALNRLDCAASFCCATVVLEILVASAERVFSNEAVGDSSLYEDGLSVFMV